MRAIAAFVGGFLILGAAAAQDLLRPGDTNSGLVRFFKIQHPSGTTWISVYQMTSDKPRKFAADDEFCDEKIPPKTFHLVVMDDKAKKAQLDRLLGKRISVVLESFACSETAWHVGDAVVFQWHFAKPPNR
jgi:hypothetical protein